MTTNRPYMHTSKEAPGALPRAVVDWLATHVRAGARRTHYFDRAQRFVDYWLRGPEQAEALTQAWTAIERAALNEDALITVFIALPDEPSAEHLAYLNVHRTVDAGEEMRRNKTTRKHIAAVRASLAGNAIRRHAADARASGPGAQLAYRAFIEAKQPMLVGLAAFDQMLALLDATAKMSTKQYASPDLPEKNYRRQIAYLNDHLRKPRHAELAFVASVNFPTIVIPRNTLSRIWRRRGDKTGQD